MKQSKIQFDIPILRRFEFIENNFITQTNDFMLGIKIENKYKKDEKMDRAQVILSVDIGEKNEKSPYYISVEYSANFIWENGIPNIDDYLNINAPALLYGYVRTLVSTVLSNTKFMRLDLPFMDFSNTVNKGKKNNS